MKGAQAGSSRRVRLMMCTPYFSPHVGGVEAFVAGLAAALARMNRFDVIVATTKLAATDPAVERIGDLKVYRLPVLWKVSYTPLHPYWPMMLRKIIRKERPDVINAHMPVPIFAEASALAAGSTPFILTDHAATLRQEGRPLFNLSAAVYQLPWRILLARCDRILPVSQYVAEGLPPSISSKVRIFENAIDGAAIRRDVRVRPGRELIFLARLDPTHSWKGLDLVLQALRLYRDKYEGPLTLTVMGDGQSRPAYEKMAKDMDLDNVVNFVGNKQGQEKFEILSRALAMVVYPKTSNDAFPTVLLEAWASGLPVIAADIGPLPSLVRHEIDGLVVPSIEPAALAAAFYGLTTSDARWSAMSAAGWARVKSGYTWDKRADDFENILQDLVPEVMKQRRDLT